MSKTFKTLNLLERSPKRINLPVKIKTQRLLFHKTNTSSDILRNNGYQVYSYGYRERKSLKNQCNKLFTLSSQIVMLSNKYDSDLTLFNSINPHFISTNAINCIQTQESNNKTFKDYIVASYKSKNVIINMKDILNSPEFVPKIKCQIDLVNISNDNLSKTPRTIKTGINYNSTLEANRKKRGQNMTRLQKEKLALKESRLKNIMSKSPSHVNSKACKMNNNQHMIKNKAYIHSLKTNAKTEEYDHSSKINNCPNTLMSVNDIQNSTLKKLQVLKEQLSKMKTNSKESKIDDSNDEKKISNNIQSHTYYYKTEVDSDEDLSSYNSKPLYSVLKSYLDEK